MGIIADTFAAQLADLKRRSDETDRLVADHITRTKALIASLADEEPISDEEMIAEAILLLQEHGYTVIKRPKA